MNKIQKQKYKTLIENADLYPINITEFAKKFGYEILENNDLSLEIIGYKTDKSLAYKEKTMTKHYTGKTIILNKKYPYEIKRFCVSYFLSKDFLDKLEETDIYSCISIPDEEAFQLTKYLLIPEEVLSREFNIQKEEDFETSKVLSKKLNVPINLLYDKRREK